MTVVNAAFVFFNPLNRDILRPFGINKEYSNLNNVFVPSDNFDIFNRVDGVDRFDRFDKLERLQTWKT